MFPIKGTTFEATHIHMPYGVVNIEVSKSKYAYHYKEIFRTVNNLANALQIRVIRYTYVHVLN